MPAIKDEHTGFDGGAGELREFKVIGFKDGWFLYGINDGISYQPYSLDIQLLGCSGRWFEVEIYQPDGKTPSGKPASTDGTVRGWTDRPCTTQDRGPGRGTHFDDAWAPLPPGGT